MTTIPITLTADELAAYPCRACNGTGYRNPLGKAGDVLFHQEEWRIDSMCDDVLEPGGTASWWGVFVEYRDGKREWRDAPRDEWKAIYGDCDYSSAPRPADTMPEWAARIRLPRTDEGRVVSLKRLREISPTLWREFLDGRDDIDPSAEILVGVGGVK